MRHLIPVACAILATAPLIQSSTLAQTTVTLNATTVPAVTNWRNASFAVGSVGTCTNCMNGSDTGGCSATAPGVSNAITTLVATEFSAWTLPANRGITQVRVGFNGAFEGGATAEVAFGYTGSGTPSPQTFNISGGCAWRGNLVLDPPAGSAVWSKAQVDAMTLRLRRTTVGSNAPDFYCNAFRIEVTHNVDTDGDGAADVLDSDDDNDGVADASDPQPLNRFICGSTDGDTCDDCAVAGMHAPNNDGTDTDADGLCDASDSDDDNDRVPDTSDPQPLNRSVCGSTDGDTCDDCGVARTFAPDNDGCIVACPDGIAVLGVAQIVVGPQWQVNMAGTWQSFGDGQVTLPDGQAFAALGAASPRVTLLSVGHPTMLLEVRCVGTTNGTPFVSDTSHVTLCPSPYQRGARFINSPTIYLLGDDVGTIELETMGIRGGSGSGSTSGGFASMGIGIIDDGTNTILQLAAHAMESRPPPGEFDPPVFTRIMCDPLILTLDETSRFVVESNMANVFSAFPSGTHLGSLESTGVIFPGQYSISADLSAGPESAVSSNWTMTLFPWCPADFNFDGNLDPDDLGDFINCYFLVPACSRADLNQDGSIDPDDLGDMINAYFAGCP